MSDICSFQFPDTDASISFPAASASKQPSFSPAKVLPS